MSEKEIETKMGGLAHIQGKPMSKETVIDLRSDTVTLPNQEMRQAMLSAELGDDVIDVDPTVERLQSVIAERLGHEAAIFMPSGTMTNQVALRLHCRPGDEFLCEERCHIFNFEQGAFAQLSGLCLLYTSPSPRDS